MSKSENINVLQFSVMYQKINLISIITQSNNAIDIIFICFHHIIFEIKDHFDK